MAMGDLALLDADAFVPVILSRSLFADKLEREIQRIESAVRAGAVAVGGFISFPEKQAAKRLAVIPSLRLIRILPQPLLNYPLTPAVEKRLREGKTLILSGIVGTEMNLTRAHCVQTNGWIMALCEGSSSTTPSATPPITPKSTFARPSTPHSKVQQPVADDPAAIFL
jgi:hypothetical protein